MGHTKAQCWAKGGGQEGQYPEWFKGKKDQWASNSMQTITETPIVWTYGSNGKLDVWFADSAVMVHVSPHHKDFTNYQEYNKSCEIKAFGNNMVKGIGGGDVVADVKFQGNTTRICLTKVMHIPGANGKILSL